VKLTLDRILRRRVPVSASTRGKPRDGYRLARVSVSPERVELSGPATYLRGLAEVPTDTVDLTGLSEDATFEVGLALRAGQVAPVGRTTFTVTVDVEPVRGERRFEGVPVEVRDPRYASPVPSVTVVADGPAAQLDAQDVAVLRAAVEVASDYAEVAGSASLDAMSGPRVVVESAAEGVRVLRIEPEAVPLVLVPPAFGVTPPEVSP
jgi:YbbR domain-containing protein